MDPAMTEARYRVVLNLYDGDELVGQEVAMIPAPWPSERGQGIEFIHSTVYEEDSDTTVMIAAQVTVTRTEID